MRIRGRRDILVEWSFYYSFNFSFIFLIFFSSCNTEPSVVVSQNEKTPVSIARNFTMTYTDSTLTKSFVSGKTHYDFTNDQLNFSEFFEDVELIIYDDNKTSIISSDYAIVYNSYRFMEFKGNVEITTTCIISSFYIYSYCY